MSMQLTILGCGNMGRAILSGVLRAGLVPAQQVRITSLKGEAIPDRDFELWYINGDQPAVSMGVIPVHQRLEIPLDAATQANIGPGTVLAVTLEQTGGSPTGVAQGPIVAVGSAIPI